MDDKGRTQSYTAASQQVPKIAGKPPNGRKSQEKIPLEMSEGAWPCSHLDSDF